MNKKIPILIIGVGSIGSRHMRNLIALGYNNIAVVDTKTKCDIIKKTFFVRCYTNTLRALKTEKPFVTFICVPTNLHIPYARLALSLNSHIFIEKPISNNLSGIDSLIHDAKKRRLTAMVACNYIFQLSIKKLEEIIKNKRFGIPISCKISVGYYLPLARKNVNYKSIYASNRLLGGGVVLDSGSHVVNYLIGFFGKIKKGFVITGLTHQLGIQSEESAILHLYHNSGLVSSVWLDYISKKPMHRIEVLTDKGLLTLDANSNQIVFSDAADSKIIFKENSDTNMAYINEIKHFLNCVYNHKQPLQNLVEGKNVLKTLLSLRRI